MASIHPLCSGNSPKSLEEGLREKHSRGSDKVLEEGKWWYGRKKSHASHNASSISQLLMSRSAQYQFLETVWVSRDHLFGGVTSYIHLERHFYGIELIFLYTLSQAPQKHSQNDWIPRDPGKIWLCQRKYQEIAARDCMKRMSAEPYNKETKKDLWMGGSRGGNQEMSHRALDMHAHRKFGFGNLHPALGQIAWMVGIERADDGERVHGWQALSAHGVWDRVAGSSMGGGGGGGYRVRMGCTMSGCWGTKRRASGGQYTMKGCGSCNGQLHGPQVDWRATKGGGSSWNMEETEEQAGGPEAKGSLCSGEWKQGANGDRNKMIAPFGVAVECHQLRRGGRANGSDPLDIWSVKDWEF
ncbi:hypothetical protein DFH08DRAFT_807165 [Mycena albidolilacea]|uniref:Uncharacterized protein n=1 Tax=Mycena albidolilacea TaxID=1033008 RepID=A0AAD7ETK3_9AGAR|nr:hypothetical protein DFH08DRAFT_807165 [Mycena albidolilacea]